VVVGVRKDPPNRGVGCLGQFLGLFDGRLVGGALSLLDDVEGRHPPGIVGFERSRRHQRVLLVRDRHENVREQPATVGLRGGHNRYLPSKYLYPFEGRRRSPRSDNV